MRPPPSAMLAGFEELHFRIWLVKPNNSCFGNALVILYDVRVSLCPLSQTFSSRKSFTCASWFLLIANCYLLIASPRLRLREPIRRHALVESLGDLVMRRSTAVAHGELGRMLR